MGRRLTVATAEEVTGKRAGLASATLDALGVSEGDPLRVEGTRRTAAAATPADVDGTTVALGPTGRRNAGVDPGESVEVTAVAATPADAVVLAPVNDLSLRGGEATLARALRGLPLLAGDRVRVPLFSGSLRLPFVAVETSPEGVVVPDADTDVTVRDDPASVLDRRRDGPRRVRLEDLGGVGETAGLLADLLVAPLRDPERFERLGRPPTSGVLLHGPAGVGKTHLVHALANESGATYLPVRGADVAGRGGDATADRLDDVVTRARREAPALVHLSDLAVAAPADASGGDRRTVAQVAEAVERLADAPRVSVVGETRRPGDVAEAVRRGGRLERAVELPAPGREGRAETLRTMARTLRLGADVDVDAVAARTHGFVAADLATLLREATLRAVRRRDRSTAVPDAEDDDLAVTAADLEAARDAVAPSAMSGFRVSVPELTYDDVGGLEDAKRELVRAVEWPLRHPDLFERFGTAPTRGLLLYGPPGTGKTLLARAVASATDANFISVNGPELLDKYVGESERAVRNVFATARQNAPAVVFFDEIDAVSAARGDDEGGGSRAPERVVSQLLTEIDGIERLQAVTVVGATNRPDRIDPALLRPGRLERVVEVPMPDREARREILEVHVRDVPLGDVDLDDVAERTDGYTGSDVEALVREACLVAIEERLRAGDGRGVVTASDFERALESVRPSVSADQRAYYERVGDRLGR
ncbi:MAG: AAA family ATPase [Haloferacaceae archaeon]